MKKSIKLLSVLLLVIFVCACKRGNWEYSERVDEMTSEKVYSATCVSTNEPEFQFPYNGGSTLELIITKGDGNSDIMLYLDKGLINMSIKGNMGIIRMRFDDGGVIPFLYESSKSGSLNYAFLDSKDSEIIVNSLKQSKSLKIEVPVFNEGNVVFDFNTEGLNWE